MSDENSPARLPRLSTENLSIVAPRRPIFTQARQIVRLTGHTLYGAVLQGIDGQMVEIQARAMSDIPETPWSKAVKVTGTAQGSVRETLDRISGAFATFSIPNPDFQILVNLAPADLAKNGTWLDLPLAIVLLQASGLFPAFAKDLQQQYLMFGELDIHGEVRRVPGALSLAQTARPGQIIIVPFENAAECSLIRATAEHEGCQVLPVESLSDVIDIVFNGKLVSNAMEQISRVRNVIKKPWDFSVIKGQARAKRAAVIAAAGGHNLLFVGPQGEGKTTIARALPGIMPPLRNDERVLLTRIYSASGLLDEDGLAVARRPVREVHHSATKESLLGGGRGIPKPGEITLAHLGVLFLDELPLFKPTTLEGLRQPLEDGNIALSRVNGTQRFPCRFTLVAAMNPCPCGEPECLCSEKVKAKYLRRLSGPVLDRIDLIIFMDRLTTEEQFEPSGPDESPALTQQVQKARELQHSRFEGQPIPFNAAISGGHGEVLQKCEFGDDAAVCYKEIHKDRSFSTRVMTRIAKVARTIADLAGEVTVLPEHVSEADSLMNDRSRLSTSKRPNQDTVL